ncbi:MAG: 16S rRNA (uracil(1498)-N(3))-methyltransferase [Candidatus Rokuibacteriota bacterium]|nr:MAG: 16S rRNA (uracil(1498)-N(3))-methyltransferase [Candidatus Rokubacteria bacterium]
MRAACRRRLGLACLRVAGAFVSRFYASPEAVAGEEVAFDAQETRHLARVLRLRPGAVVRAIDGRGQQLTVRLTRIGARGAEGKVLDRTVHRSESPLDLTLVQAVPKGEKLELIIRMTTELGITRVVPIYSDRSVPRLEQERESTRVARWQRVAREAAKQSGRAVIPDILRPVPLSEWLTEPRPPGLILCLWEDSDRSAATVLPEQHPDKATLLVGPEGGFTDEEVEQAKAAGAIVAGLGPRILRTETAGPVGVALLQARYGDLGTAG